MDPNVVGLCVLGGAALIVGVVWLVHFYSASAGRKELDNARLRRRWASNPQYREKARARRYGLTWQTYQAILARQGQACAICGTAERPLCIDHCHASGKVRGLLCGPCNRGLGCYRDGPNLLRAAAAYLDENG